MEQKKIAIVIDSNVLIKQLKLNEILKTEENQNFGDKYEVHTLTDVIKEIRDEQARNAIQLLPYEIVIHENLDEENFDMVRQFAKETGDLPSLSQTDMKVIALGIQLAKERGEFDKLNKSPKPLTEFRPKKFENEYKKIQEQEEDEEEEEEQQKQKEIVDDDGFQQVTKKRHGDRKNHARLNNKQYKNEKEETEFKQEETVEPKKEDKSELNNKEQDTTKVEEQEKVQQQEPIVKEQNNEENANDSSGIDDEEEGGEWVTQENLYKHISHADTAPVDKVEENIPQQVWLMTSDFAMQNVIIQMNFKLLGLRGARVTRIKRYKNLCRACQKLNLNIERQFCDFCGSHTLIKVSVYISSKGDLTYFKNPLRLAKLRGTKYSIPLPKGGRNNDDLILREDELLVGEKKYLVKKIEREQRQMQKQLEDTLQGNYWAGGEGYGASVSNLLYENGAKGGKTHSKVKGMNDHIVIGHGKKNPNAQKRKTGNKK